MALQTFRIKSLCMDLHWLLMEAISSSTLFDVLHRPCSPLATIFCSPGGLSQGSKEAINLWARILCSRSVRFGPFWMCGWVLHKPRSFARREAVASPMQWLKRFCDNICRFRHGPKMSFSLTSNGWVFFTFPVKKGTFPFLPHSH